MKSRIVLLFVILLALSACGSESPEEHITGRWEIFDSPYPVIVEFMPGGTVVIEVTIGTTDEVVRDLIDEGWSINHNGELCVDGRLINNDSGMVCTPYEIGSDYLTVSDGMQEFVLRRAE